MTMTTSAHAQLQQLRSDLMTRFPERRDAIDGALAAVVAGGHIRLRGPPGPAKSALGRARAQAGGGTLVVRLRTMVPPLKNIG
jgi:MoxR-like ATPase